MRDGSEVGRGTARGQRRIRGKPLSETTSGSVLADLSADESRWSVRPSCSNTQVVAVGPHVLAGAGKSERPGRIDFTKVERAMDLRRLRYFVQIVMDGSFSTAAQRVHVAQPALSHHVRELEAILGVSLLTRSAHGVVPTEAGQCLYEHGVIILGRVRDAAKEVSEFGSVSDRRVLVGLETSLASALAAPLVEENQRQAPEVQVAIEEGSREELLRLIETKGLDIALLYDVPEQRVLTRKPLLTETLYLVGSRDGDRTEMIAFEDVARLPLILPRRPNRIRERLEEQAQRARMPLNIIVEIDNITSIKKLVRAGLGYSVLPAFGFYEEFRMGLLDKRLIVQPSLEQTLSLCHLTGCQLSGSAAKVHQLALQVIDNLIDCAMWPGIAPDKLHGSVLRHAALG